MKRREVWSLNWICWSLERGGSLDWGSFGFWESDSLDSDEGRGFRLQTEGREVQVNPDSMKPAAEHPSPFAVFMSSQTSGPTISPSPVIGTQISG